MIMGKEVIPTKAYPEKIFIVIFLLIYRDKKRGCSHTYVEEF